jgi:hypothetical protein
MCQAFESTLPLEIINGATLGRGASPGAVTASPVPVRGGREPRSAVIQQDLTEYPELAGKRKLFGDVDELHAARCAARRQPKGA